MSYKYRQGETPDHVNSADSNSIPTPKIAPKDATNVVNASGPNADSGGDKLQASRLKKIGFNSSADEADDRASKADMNKDKALKTANLK